MPLGLSLSSIGMMMHHRCEVNDAMVQPVDSEWPIMTNKCDGGDCYDN
jgi:hypothetical protein